MRIAYLHYTPKGINPANFYYYGWGKALKDHDVTEMDCVYSSLEKSDGDFDLCFVTPGSVVFKEHLYRKKSSTKYVLFLEEDMHQSIEGLRSVCGYYDYVFVLSEINFVTLQFLGVRNVRCILPCYNPEIFYPLETNKKFDVAFLGQFDTTFNIAGSTRHRICSDLERDPNVRSFIGRGFYASQANQIYNESAIVLDLPIMEIVGPRSFSVGATSATLMLPATKKPVLWQDSFLPGEDYLEFGKAEHLKSALKQWLKRPDECLSIRKNMNVKMKKHTYAERFKEILDVVYHV